MQLKKLEIQGFKTFVEPVSFNFEYPIIAIVGPNGSGKSNIVDAVKWCMGEQSTKQLRANQMSDLIFSGSEHRKSVGMAEVSLSFLNNNANVPSSYASFSEIVVTRRMYRGDESEYYLNKDPKRLKDISEFLMDIGISSKAFSIIEQGQIGEIIDVKPEMRRYVIEDAAGILKYKNRKKIALDKIELTRANMIRIADLLSEIKRQLNQVNKQVKIAQEYKSLKNEYKTLDLKLLKTEYTQLTSALNEKKASLEQARFELAKLTSLVSARYTDHQRFKDRLDKQTADISEKQNRINSLSAETMVLKEKIESSKRLKETLLRENERIHLNIDEFLEREAYLKNQIQTEQQKLTEEKRELGSLDKVLELHEKEKRELIIQINEIKDKIEEERNNEFTRVKKITEIDNRILAAEHDVENIVSRLEKIEHDKASIDQKIKTLKDDKGDLEEQEKLNTSGIENADRLIADINEQINGVSGKIEKASVVIEQTKKEFENARSRYLTLNDLRKNLDGYSEGTRFIIKQARQFNIDKVLADYINVKQGYELAVQAVLGDIIQAVVVSEYDTAKGIIDMLRERDNGRAVFIVKSGFKPVASASEDGGTPLLAMIDIKDNTMLPVFQRLLNNVYVVSSLKEAAALANHDAVAVTTLGDVVKAGIVYGGSEGSIKGGILDRRNELERLKQKIDSLSGELKRYEQDKAQLMDELNIRNANLSDNITKKQEMERQQLNIKIKMQNIDDQLNDYETSLLTIGMEEEELKRNMSELYEEVSDLKQKKAIYEEDKGANTGLIDDLRNTLVEVESQLDKKKELISESNARSAVYKERLGAKYNDIKRMQMEYDGISRKFASLKSEAENNSGRVAVIDQEVTSSGGKLAAISKDMQSLEDAITDAKTFYDDEFKEQSEIEQEIKQLEKEIAAFREKESAYNIEVSELAIKSNYSSDTVRDKYGIELEQYETELINEDEMQKNRDGLAVLAEKIAKMGDVNIGAINEYEELKKRVDFYEGHEQDLEKAIDDLKKVINSINKESRKLFREIFDRVNENFKKVVPKLFDGGKGELILTDEQDLLESGMEIVVQPSGKRLQNINLLSGGEKALAAVALLISVFMVKPSPFALLDEIDAPLDDASVIRLNNLIKELSKNSNFILITHNKTTIEIADVIYGMTMEEPGVSKVLSIKLQKEAV